MKYTLHKVHKITHFLIVTLQFNCIFIAFYILFFNYVNSIIASCNHFIASLQIFAPSKFVIYYAL
jgi:hypothetical protein